MLWLKVQVISRSDHMITLLKNLPCSWSGTIHVIKMTVLPKVIYRFSAMPIKLPVAVFTELEQIVLKLAKQKRPQIAKAILRKGNGAGKIVLPDFRLYHRIIKTVYYWHKSRHIGQWNSIESPELNSCTYQSMTKKARIHSGEKTFFNRWGRENWTVTCKRMMLEHSLTSYPEIRSKFIKDLIVGLFTIKFLEGSTGRTLLDINRNNYFFGFVS